MTRPKVYPGTRGGAPTLHLRLHPDVLEWIRTVKGYGWARAQLEAAFTAETGREVPFPNKIRRERRGRSAEQE